MLQIYECHETKRCAFVLNKTDKLYNSVTYLNENINDDSFLGMRAYRILKFMFCREEQEMSTAISFSFLPSLLSKCLNRVLVTYCCVGMFSFSAFLIYSIDELFCCCQRDRRLQLFVWFIDFIFEWKLKTKSLKSNIIAEFPSSLWHKKLLKSIWEVRFDFEWIIYGRDNECNWSN